VYAPAAVETWSTAVPVDTPPTLPATLRLAYTDGVTQYAPVAWQPVPPTNYAGAGQFTVTGTVAGTALPARASIRVTASVTPAQNIAAAAGSLAPSADASYSGSPSTVPAAILDGGTVTGGWSNAFTKAATALLPSFSGGRIADWVSVSWPNPQRFGTVTGYFVVDARHALPAAIAVSRWTGTGYAPVSGLAVTWAGTVATTTFDPIGTTAVRVEMTSAYPGASNGGIQLAELTVTGDVVAYQSAAALTELTVNGRPVPGFDPGTTSYSVTVAPGTPSIAARAVDNGRILVVPPGELPGTARVTVTAEDGLTQRTYELHLTTHR
jgi:beta-galactosidase